MSTLPDSFRAKYAAACDLCAKDGPVYQHDRLCCCVRWLLKEPRREVRQAWLSRVSRRSRGLAEAVAAEVRLHWHARRAAA